MKRILFLIVLLVVLNGCTSTQEQTQIVTTIYPLEFLTESIVGDSNTVSSVYPTGSDIHSYEISTQDIETILNSDVFICMSEDLEQFVPTIKESVENGESDVTVIEVVKEDKLLDSIDKSDFSSLEDKTLKDNHIWTSPKKALLMNEIIYDELSIIYPNNEEVYKSNYLENKSELENLDKEYSNLEIDKPIYVGHNAFYWLNKDYDLDIQSLYSDEHDEVSSKEMLNIIENIKEEGIEVIYTDVNDPNNEVIMQIAKEAEIEIDYLNELETYTNESNYFQGLEYNLEQIQKGSL